MQRLFKDLKGITEEKINELVKEREAIFEAIGDKYTKVIEGFTDFVKSVKNHTDKIGIGTSSSMAHVDKAMEMFEKAGLKNPKSYFKAIVTGDMVTKGKPHPETYNKVREMLDVSPENCVLFEDSKPGIISSLDAGIKNVVALATSHSPEQLDEMLQKGMVKNVIKDYTEFSDKDFLQLIGEREKIVV